MQAMQAMHECTNARMRTRLRLKRAASALRHSCMLCICALLVAASLPACLSVHAKTAADSPMLDVPTPPERMVEPMVVEAQQPIPLPEDPRPVPIRPIRPAAPPAAAARPDQPKPDIPQVAAESPKAPEETAAKPAITLQTTPTSEEGEVERGIRATLARATADLSRVNYRALNTEGRAQYNTAKRFIQQADDAIHQKNLVLAKNLADKAATIAVQQAGR